MIFDVTKIAEKDLQCLFKYVTEEKSKNYLTKTKEHYRLLAALSDLFHDKILVDIGTFKGLSALSLAVNMQNKVITVNKENRSNFLGKAIDDGFPIEIVLYNILKVRENEKLVEDIKKSSVILLDITHNGKDEKEFYEFLLEIDYKGILVADDIYLKRNGDMLGFWKSIKEKKYDLTEYGHWSGTGIVDFSKQLEIKWTT